nr:uncharacterized protein LOC123570192 isoform X2 [Macaca fascicularis]
MKTFDLVCVHSKLMTYKSGCGSRTSQPQGTAGAQACKSRNEKESLNSIWRSEYLSPEHLCNDASSNQEKLQLGRYTQTAWSSMYPKNKEKVGSFITRRNVTYLFFKKVRGTCKVLGSEQALIVALPNICIFVPGKDADRSWLNRMSTPEPITALGVSFLWSTEKQPDLH